MTPETPRLRRPEDADPDLLIGWPWPMDERPPLVIGQVSGIPWAVAQGGSKHNPNGCGYSRIPWEGHPWSGCTSYDDLDVEVHGGLTFGPHPSYDMGATAAQLEADTADSDSVPFISPLPKSYVYPGSSFAQCGGWVGFDTGHAWDVWTDDSLSELGVTRERLSADGNDDFLNPMRHVDPYSMFWTLDKLIHEAQGLAQQIADAGKIDRPKPKGRNG